MGRPLADLLPLAPTGAAHHRGELMTGGIKLPFAGTLLGELDDFELVHGLASFGLLVCRVVSLPMNEVWIRKDGLSTPGQ